MKANEMTEVISGIFLKGADHTFPFRQQYFGVFFNTGELLCLGYTSRPEQKQNAGCRVLYLRRYQNRMLLSPHLR